MLSNLHVVVTKQYLAIPEKYDKLITSLRTAYANELSLDKQADRVKFLNDIIQKSIGTHTRNLERGGHLSYRNPSPNNDHSGTHGGSYSWNQFCDLSIEELGECQEKNYYRDSSDNLKDKDGHTMKWQGDKLQAIK
jgi:hypothetical protein